MTHAGSPGGVAIVCDKLSLVDATVISSYKLQYSNPVRLSSLKIVS